MADVITRLKVESQEYDAKIKRAAQGLLQMEEACRKVGGTLAVLEKEDKDFVASLGQMETVSKSARGRLNELTQAFTDLSIQYKRLTDEEKQGDFGKALSSSLDQLKVRINDAKADLDGVSKELGNTSSVSNETGGVIDNLASKFGLSAKALLGWGTAIAAGKAALDVAKDAFFASEANIDEWGRTVESSQMLYEGFLNALNTGDIGGYLQNMNNIAQAARDAYDELDRLGTMKTINAPGTSGRQTEISRLQGMLRTGRAMDSLTGGKAYADDGALLSKQQRKQIADDLKALLKESREVSQQEIDQATSAINALYTEQAAVLGMNTEAFKKGTANMQEFDKVLEGAKKYREFEQAHTSYVSTTSPTVGATYTSIVRDKAVNPYEQFKAWRDFKDDGPMYQRLVQEIQKRDKATQQFYGLVNQSYRGINRAEGVRVGGTGDGNKPTTPSEKEVTIQQQIAALEKEAVTASDERLQEIILTVAALDKQLALEKEIKDVVHGRTPTLNQPVGNRKAFEQQQMVQFEEAFVNVTPKLSEVNISSFISSLKKQLANAEIGSELYNNLTAQITDAQTLGTLISEAVKRGIDVTQINPQELWAKIFGDNPGDYITEDEWKAIQDKLNEYAKKNPIKVNFETGTSQGSSSGAKEAEEKRSMSIAEISRNVLSVTRSLSDLGVEIPDGLTKVLSTMNIITTILGTINTFMGITATTSALKSIPIIGAFLHNGGVVHAANGFSGIVPGTQYSGDQVPAMLDAGEVVLNRAQAGTVASLLTAPQGGNVGRSIATVESDQIKLVLMNGAQSRGMTLGQYLEL